jgi:membrane associated rhomboid family serine protease
LETRHLTNIGDISFSWKNLIDGIVVSAFLLLLVWACFLVDEFDMFHLKQHGLRPRSAEGLIGIFSMFFIHGSWEHILHNSMGFMVLNTLLFYIYRKIALPVFGVMFFVTPILVWIFARPSNHIGASGVIYALFGFLLMGGVFSDNPILRRITLFVVFYYGSLIWWIFPIKAEVSWEGHLSGMVVGMVCAYFYRHNLPKRKKYRYEVEPELPDDPDGYWLLPEQRQSKPEVTPQETTVTVKYHYIDSSDNK